MAKSKSGELMKNTSILVIGNFSSKVLVFLLVPLYTAVLSKEDVGSFDLIHNTASLMLPILTLNVADAVLRFPLDDNSDNIGIIRIGLWITLISCIPIAVAQWIPVAPWHNLAGINWLTALYATQALSSLLSLFARGTQNLRDVAVAGVIGTVVMLITNILMLLVWRMGLNGYFLAFILSNVTSAGYLTLRLRKQLFGRMSSDVRELTKEMLKYSLPLALTPIGWWFINTSDRYVVTFICGVAVNGIYAVSYKIPAILNAFQGIFIQAWQISAVKEFDPIDEDGFLRRAYNIVASLMSLACSLIIATTPLIARFLFSGDFFQAWEYVPFLLIYLVANTESGMFGALLSARKDSLSITSSVLIGGVANVLLGFPLVYAIGVQGAALSSLFAGIATWLWRGKALWKHMDVRFGMRNSIKRYAFLSIQGAVLIAMGPSMSAVAVSLALSAILAFWLRLPLSQAASSLANQRFGTRK